MTEREHLFDTAADLKRTADEVRVQLRLAVADAEVHWNEAQKRLFALKSRLESNADDNIAELSTATLTVIDDVRQRVEAVRARHERHRAK